MRRKPTELGSLDDAAPNPIARKPVRSGMGPPQPRELPSVDELMAAIDGPANAPMAGAPAGGAPMSGMPMGRGGPDASGVVADLQPMDGPPTGGPSPLEPMGAGGSAPVETMDAAPMKPPVAEAPPMQTLPQPALAGAGARSPQRIELAQLLAMLRGGRGVRQ